MPKTIVFSAIDWGLGHAVRFIPVIKVNKSAGNKIIIVGSGNSGKLLQKEFPNEIYIEIKGFDIKYSREGFRVFHFLLRFNRFLKAIKNSRKAAKQIEKKYKPDLFISDNRYGFRSKTITSVFITHQVMIKLPKKLKFAEKFVYLFHKKIIEKYDKCLIPDFFGEINMSGDLSHKYPPPKNAEYIGLLSSLENPGSKKNEYDILCILSGPEPQRSILEKILIEQISTTKYKSLIIGGKPEKETIFLKNNINYCNFATRSEIQHAILHSNLIICRSGYTGIMDLFKMKKKAVLIPTPGQTEQEYLAEYLSKTRLFARLLQSKFNIEQAFEKFNQLDGSFEEYTNLNTVNTSKVFSSIV